MITYRLFQLGTVVGRLLGGWYMFVVVIFFFLSIVILYVNGLFHQDMIHSESGNDEKSYDRV